MGKLIRRTRTMTITEIWTLVWLPGDDHVVGAKRHPLPYPPTVEPDPTHREEPLDEMLQATLSLAAPGPLPHTPGAVVDPQLADKATARRRGQRPRVRRAKVNRPKK